MSEIMHEALTLLGELTESDIAWFFESASEQRMKAGTVIIQEAIHPECLYIVLEGLVGVKISMLGDKQVKVLGPGELLGEMSFIENCPASATVSAVENSLILMLPRTKLQMKLKEDLGFAYRLHRSFAIVLSKRLRERERFIGRHLAEWPENVQVISPVWSKLSQSLETFKSLLQKADQEALKNEGALHTGLVEQIEIAYRHFCDLMNAEIGDSSSEDVHVRRELGARVQRELLPFLLLTQVSERAYSKPRGYAGDFLTIDWMYRNEASGYGRLGPLIDRMCLNMRAVHAVQNRRGLLAEEIFKVIEDKKPSAAKVVSLACGPAQEVFDVFGQLEDPALLKASLVDIDMSALAHVADKRDKLKLRSQMDLFNGNLVYLATGRQQLKLKNQDLVYSVGLIDYFSDKFVVALLGYIYDLLKPGGKVILGNFHPRNPDKAVMDYVFDWKLIHRSEDDLNRLYFTSKFGKHCTNTRFEKEGINLFAECIKG